MATPAFAAPPPTSRSAGRFVAGLLWLVAAGLAIGASFVPFYRSTQTLGDDRKFEYAVSGWSWNLRVTGNVNVEFGPPTLFGIPLVLAGITLLLAAIVAFTRRSPRIIGMLGTGLVIGAASMEFVDAIATEARSRENFTTTIELGTWLLVGSAALAIIGAIVSLVRPRPRPQPHPMWQPRMEPETPRFGFPSPNLGWSTPATGPPSQPFPAANPPSQPFPAANPPSQPFPAAGQPFPTADPHNPPSQSAGPPNPASPAASPPNPAAYPPNQPFPPTGPPSQPFPAANPSAPAAPPAGPPNPASPPAGSPPDH